MMEKNIVVIVHSTVISKKEGRNKTSNQSEINPKTKAHDKLSEKKKKKKFTKKGFPRSVSRKFPLRLLFCILTAVPYMRVLDY